MTKKPFGNYSIEIEGDQTYCDSVVGVLNTMLKFSFCQILFNCLPNNKTIVIRPFVPTHNDRCNAFSYPAEKNGWFSTIFPINFTPGIWEIGSFCFKSGPGGTTDEILMHEMLHTYRRVNGTFIGKAFSKTEKDFDTVEEIFAIVLTNIYISEKGKPLLRKDHQGFNVLPQQWTTSDGIMRDHDYNEWISKFWNTDNALASKLSHSTAPFNPFRDYRQVTFGR
jgi:Effector protein